MFSCLFPAICAPYLRAASADRSETFKHDWKCVNLDDVSPKIGRLPKKQFLGQLVWGQNLRAPRPIAAKLCQIVGTRLSFIS